MSWNYFYKDRAGRQNGPVSIEELVALVRAGRIAPDCLVWPEGGEPRQAAAYPEIAAALEERATATASGAMGPLRPELPVWGFFWRSVVFTIGVALLVPAPWVGLWFYRWVAERISLPNGVRLALDSSVGQCWYIFVGLGLSQAAPRTFVHSHFHGLALLAGSLGIVFFGFLLVGWFSRALRSEDRGFNVGFEGGFWTYLGWDLLIFVAIFTIIGWAWAAKNKMRWICRTTRGTHQFEFVATGWELLWRSLALILGSVFILPIPWLFRWFYSWYIAQIVVSPGAPAAATVEPVAQAA